MSMVALVIVTPRILLRVTIVIAAQFTIAKCLKQPNCPSVNEWIKNLWYIYKMEVYAAERKSS